MTEPAVPAGGGDRVGDRPRTVLSRTTAGAEMVDVLLEQGHLAAIDRHFAAFVSDLDGGGGPELALAAALASAWTRDGHACVALHEVAGRDWPRPGGARLPDLDVWVAALDASPIVARSGDAERRPLVLDGGGRLYLERLWTAETDVAASLLGLAGAAGPAAASLLGLAGVAGPAAAGLAGAAEPRGGHPEERAGAVHDRAGSGGGRGRSHRRVAVREDSVRGPEGLDAALDRLFPDADSGDRAPMAARTAASRRLCVVSGGPGTGKTTVAAAIVALLIELRLAAPERIALAAPTGKAAARLQEAVRGRHRALVSRIPALEGYEAHATTVHRWLFSRARTRRPIDALVLDESSMVDLTLMARVLAALPGDARFVLLGDASQLASVQPGAVFADLCRAGLGTGKFRVADETAATAGVGVGDGADGSSGEGGSIGAGVGNGDFGSSGKGGSIGTGVGNGDVGSGGEGGSTGTGIGNGDVGSAGGRAGGRDSAAAGTGARGGGAARTQAGGSASPESTPLAPCVVELVHNWRFDVAGGIGRLAAAVVRGDGGGAVAALLDPADAVTELRPVTDARHFERLATTFVDERFAPALRAMQSVSAFRELGADTGTGAGPLSAFRVLCAHRIGAFGAERFNRLAERRLRALGLVPADDVFYPGRPILVTRNDPRTGLSNGDTGIVVRDADARIAVWFPELEDAEGRPRLVAPARLPPHESFFAVTVHRAQGSEYDEVAVVLGPAESRVATRELLYTALTRARRRVVVYGSEESVAAAVGRATERYSGLREALCQRAYP